MWQELLPLGAETSRVSLGEVFTPLVPVTNSRGHDSGAVYIKDEGRLPTGSFKARGLAVAVSMAGQFEETNLVLPTAGNAGAAAAAYGAAAGMQVHVFAPKDTPQITIQETAFLGAQVHQVDGLIDKCGELVD